MKPLAEYAVVAVIAVLMAAVGYVAIDWHGGGQWRFLDPKDVGWTLWTSGVSILTWFYLYRVGRRLHWLVLPVLGLVSPLIGCILFFLPYFFAPWLVIWEHAVVVFPTGILCGLLISVATLPFRPRTVLHGNA